MKKIMLTVSIVSLVVILGFSGGYFSRFFKADAPASAVVRASKPGMVGNSQGKTISDVDPMASSGQMSEPAWFTPQKSASAPQQKSATPTTTPDRRSDEFLAAVAQLQLLQKSDTSDPKEVAAALAQLEKANGSPLLHGLRLDVLRKNLELTAKITSLAESNKETADAVSTAPSDPASMRAREAASRLKFDQIEALRKQISMDFMVSKSPANQP